MKKKSSMYILRVVIMIVLVILNVGCESTYNYYDGPIKAPAVIVNDVDIVANIQDRIATDPALSDVAIKIYAKNGIVSLIGIVDNNAQVKRIALLAQTTPYVKQVDIRGLKVKK